MMVEALTVGEPRRSVVQKATLGRYWYGFTMIGTTVPTAPQPEPGTAYMVTDELIDVDAGIKLVLHEPIETARTSIIIGPSNTEVGLSAQNRLWATYLQGFFDDSQNSFPTVFARQTPHDFLERFSRKAQTLVEQARIPWNGATIQDWSSVDDPVWQQHVLYISVCCDSRTGLDLWDRLSAQLREDIDSEGPAFAAILVDRLSVSVKWAGNATV